MLNRLTQFTSLLLIVLMGWNLFGWWLFPVSSSIISGSLSGEACCNGAEICCCTSAGADACYCLPGEVHDDSESSDKTLVCGISSPDDRNHSDEKGTLTFLEIRAFIAIASIYQPFSHSRRTLCTSITSPSSTYISDLLRPPEFV